MPSTTAMCWRSSSQQGGAWDRRRLVLADKSLLERGAEGAGDGRPASRSR